MLIPNVDTRYTILKNQRRKLASEYEWKKVEFAFIKFEGMQNNRRKILVKSI